MGIGELGSELGGEVHEWEGMTWQEGSVASGGYPFDSRVMSRAAVKVTSIGYCLIF